MNAPIPRIGTSFVVAIPPGSSVTTFGDLLVVAHPELPPFTVHRFTGERSLIKTDPAPVVPRLPLSLEPMK